jgi:ribokinase
LLAQLEVPLETVAVATAAARSAGVTTILNAAPAQPLSTEFLSNVDLLVANETESEQLGSVSFHGVAVITNGERGALVLAPGEPHRRFASLRVPVVDTTAAGDAFCGCLAAALAAGRSLDDAVSRAMAAGACAVTSEGAFASLPYGEEVDDLLGQVGSDSHS